MGSSGHVKIRITLAEQYEIVSFLKNEDVLKIIDKGVCMYAPLWSDEKVAVHFSNVFKHPVTKNNVAGVREKLFGNLGIVSRSVGQAELNLHGGILNRIEALEAAVGIMRAHMDALEKDNVSLRLAAKFKVT